MDRVMSIQDFSKDFVEKNTRLDKGFENIQKQTNEICEIIEEYFHPLDDGTLKLWCEYVNAPFDEFKGDYEASKEKYGYVDAHMYKLERKIFGV